MMSWYKKITKLKLGNVYVFEVLAIIIMILYPLRHVCVGLDMWDVGYNCVNAKYFNANNMSTVWFYSVYLSTALGHFFSLLPAGNTLAGFSAYCSIVIDICAIGSYYFFTRKIKIPKIIAFCGEFLAISLCYIPTTVMYDHLSNLLMTTAIIIIYIALSENKDNYLYLAGICLGVNIFVRFSNIPEAGLILAVWLYLIFDKKKNRIVPYTLKCLGGYIFAVLGLMLFMHINYGIRNYIDGILGLFAITDGAKDYTPISMVKELISAYIMGAERLLYIVGFVIITGIICYWIGKKNKKLSNALLFVLVLIFFAFLIIKRLLIFDFYHYATAYTSAALMFVIITIIALYRIINKESSSADKLIAILVILQMILTSLGSNTGITLSINSMYICAPYLIWQLCLLIMPIVSGEERVVTIFKLSMSYKLAATVFVTVLCVFVFQCILFGIDFTWENGGNARDNHYSVMNNDVLKNIKMNRETADRMQEITDYINANDYLERDVIIYGYVPALAYYLDLRPVLSAWADLDSYSIDELTSDLALVRDRIENADAETPLIILGGCTSLSDIDWDSPKWKLLENFIKEYNYVKTYDQNGLEVWSVN